MTTRKRADLRLAGDRPEATLNERQAEALAWLRMVGKATPAALRGHGYRASTMHALVRRGVATVEYRTATRAPFPIWRPTEETR